MSTNSDIEGGEHWQPRDRAVLLRRDFVARGVLAAALLPLSPSWVGATEIDSTLSIFGNNGDSAPSFLDTFAQNMKSMFQSDQASTRRPPPVKIPRTFLLRPFSVLLMRSSYETMDELDFVPTDKFQKEFFLLRSTEWEKYLAETDAKQGDLSDAMYFDFISAAQYATITQELRRAQSVFEERTGAEGTVSVVKRDALLQDNDLLPPAFYERVGDKVYEALVANFSGPDFYSQPPLPCSSGELGCVVDGFKQLYKVVVEAGYALDYKAEDRGATSVGEYKEAEAKLGAWRERTRNTFKVPEIKGEGRKLRVTLQAPCTLWGRQWLGMQGYMHNDHDVMVAMSYLRKSGRAAVVSTSVDQNSIVREYTLL